MKNKYVAVVLIDGKIDEDLIRVFRNEDDANTYIAKCFAGDLLYWHDRDITEIMEVIKNPDDFDCEIVPGYISYKLYGTYWEYMVYQVEEV